MIEKQEHRQLSKTERFRGITVIVAIITVILLISAGFAMVITAMING